MIPNRLEKYFESSAIAFFEEATASKASVTSITEISMQSHDCIMAIVGFTSAQMKGTIRLATNTQNLFRSHPQIAQGLDIEESDLANWAAEILNQILDRFKDRLLPLGFHIELSSSTLVKGSRLTFADHRGGYIFRDLATQSGLHFSLGLNVNFETNYNPSYLDTCDTNDEVPLRECALYVQQQMN